MIIEHGYYEDTEATDTKIERIEGLISNTSQRTETTRCACCGYPTELNTACTGCGYTNS